MERYTKVKDINHLRELINGGNNEFIVRLNGCMKSSKFIDNGDNDSTGFYILNYLDYSEQEVTEDELFDENITNVGKALKMGALYCDM